MERNCKIHGIHENWRYSEKKKWWICKRCVQDKRKEKRVSENYIKILNLFDLEMAEKYLKEVNENNISVNVFVKNNRIKISKKTFSRRKKYIDSVSKKRNERIILLNSISSRDINNIGWNCNNCFIYHSEPSFFDIDRIIEGKDGGKYIVGNMQILCPNCHRCKTQQILTPNVN